MPRGVPKAGFRVRHKNVKTVEPAVKLNTTAYAPDSKETDAEISARISERFEILDTLTDLCIEGEARALIVSGPAGLGKSFTVEKALENWDPARDSHTIVKGFVRATGLYKLLFKHRFDNQVIVFDDADALFFDDVSLNLLKAVCDTTERRVVSWMSEAKMEDEDGVLIPTSFEFSGTIIFITNYDFDAMIDKGHKLAPHLQAMVSRAHYIDLSMKTRRDYLVRIRQVIDQGLLSKLSDKKQKEVVKFVEDNSDNLRELSLRMAIKLGTLCQKGAGWEKLARVTCCK